MADDLWDQIFGKPKVRVKARRDWSLPNGLHQCCQHYPNHHPTCHLQIRGAEFLEKQKPEGIDHG